VITFTSVNGEHRRTLSVPSERANPSQSGLNLPNLTIGYGPYALNVVSTLLDAHGGTRHVAKKPVLGPSHAPQQSVLAGARKVIRGTEQGECCQQGSANASERRYSR
jgi:hypothetical protein